MDDAAPFGLALVAIMVAAVVILGQTNLVAANRVRMVTAQLESSYPTIRDAYLQEIQTYESAHPGAALSEAVLTTPTTPSGMAVSATLKNGTPASTSGTDVAYNLDTASDEQRAALDITLVESGTHVAIAHRVLLRSYATTPYYETISDNNVSADTIRTIPAAADVGGCAGTGSGCDPNQVQTATSSLTKTLEPCADGAGSGTCAPGQTRDISTYGNTPWTNAQTGETP